MKIDELTENNNNNNNSVNWAIGEDVVHGSLPFKNRIMNGYYDDSVIVYINIREVFDNTEEDFRLDVDDPTGGPMSIGNRVEKAKQFFKVGYMDLSEIGYSSYNNAIVFTDGRHRLVAAYQLGERYAPIIVPKSHIGAIKGMVSSKGQLIDFGEIKEVLSRELLFRNIK